MSRFYCNPKRTVRQCCVLSIFKLKEWNLLDKYSQCKIKWIVYGREHSAGLVVNTSVKQPYTRISYNISSSKIKYDYKIMLDETRCNLGGFRWWFICPKCGRRSGKLYRKPKSEVFLCRICNNLSYESRNITLSGGDIHKLIQISDISYKYDDLVDSIKRWEWAGRPTRKARKLQKLEQKLCRLAESCEAIKDKL